jgi:hypothetical protein
MTPKEKPLPTIQQLPDDVEPEALLQELGHIVMLLPRLEEAKTETPITQDDAKRRMARWLK